MEENSKVVQTVNNFYSSQQPSEGKSSLKYHHIIDENLAGFVHYLKTTVLRGPSMP